MSNVLTLFDTLIKESIEAGGCREHTMESMHYAAEKPIERLSEKLNQLIEEISQPFGKAEHDFLISEEGKETRLLPNWFQQGRSKSGHIKIVRFVCWRYGASNTYAIICTELDAKDRPNYHRLVIGAKKRVSEGIKINTLRGKQPNLLDKIISFFRS